MSSEKQLRSALEASRNAWLRMAKRADEDGRPSDARRARVLASRCEELRLAHGGKPRRVEK